jgi:hypothetical protein
LTKLWYGSYTSIQPRLFCVVFTSQMPFSKRWRVMGCYEGNLQPWWCILNFPLFCRLSLYVVFFCRLPNASSKVVLRTIKASIGNPLLFVLFSSFLCKEVLF